jgi:Flp pilus assembly protein TadB
MDHNPFLLGQLFLGVLIIGLVVVAFLERSRREKHRLELQKAILERVGSVKELAEFLTTEQGQRFLSALAPAHFRPHHHGLWTVRVGVVVLTVGVFLMVALHAPIFGSPAGMSPPPPLLLAIFLVIAVGLGMLLSAGVSFFIARALGLRSERGVSRKDDAV